jgi:arylsulfatase A-like enzyme
MTTMTQARGSQPITVLLPMIALSWLGAAGGLSPAAAEGGRDTAGSAPRPNILFCIADDWGWPDAGAYGDPVVKTPGFDRVAREGVLFQNAFVTSPSCTPSRNSILTGQMHWRLGAGVNLWSSLAPEHPVYPLLLEDAGYHVGHWRKAWGPGDWKALGRTRHPAGKPVSKGFREFLAARPAGKPFCFWLGASDPHRPYAEGSGAKAGLDPAKVRVPADLPDCDLVRNDLADYLLEVQRFDGDVAAALEVLAETGEAANTIVVITGDHGMPFPRHKCHLYDSGVHVPLAIRWPAAVKPGRTVTDFVSLSDLAPTFLAATGLAVPPAMTGRSLLPLLAAEGSGRIDPARDHVLVGRERHTPAQEAPGTGGYPMHRHPPLYQERGARPLADWLPDRLDQGLGLRRLRRQPHQAVSRRAAGRSLREAILRPRLREAARRGALRSRQGSRAAGERGRRSGPGRDQGRARQAARRGARRHGRPATGRPRRRTRGPSLPRADRGEGPVIPPDRAAGLRSAARFAGAVPRPQAGGTFRA